MFKKTLLVGSAAAALLLSGCGGGGGGGTATDTKTTTGYLVDSAVVNADYDCLADGEVNKTTGPNGEFSCRNMAQVRFRIGELILGEIDGLPTDGYVLPQDLLGLERNGTLYDANVTALAQFLQSLDSDGNVSNGITISETVKEALKDLNETFSAEDLEDYLEIADVPDDHIRDVNETRAHLRQTLQELARNGHRGENNESHNGGNGTPTTDGNLSVLTQELKDALAHMGNEERLAYDIYMNLYTYHEANGTEIRQLENIATRSEANHIAIVRSLVRKYELTEENLSVVESPVADSNISFEEMPSGQYDIPAIQELYDSLYAKGTQSAQDALEVGCMVEVTDVNDLDAYIAIAEESNATDVVQAFTILRSGSYNHYWAFDRGLKNMGIEDGCCSLGDEYCHPEYPQNDQGSGGNR